MSCLLVHGLTIVNLVTPAKIKTKGSFGLFSYWKPTANLSISLSGGIGWHHQQENDYTTPKTV